MMLSAVLVCLGFTFSVATDEEFLKGWIPLDDTTYLNPKTGKLYQPENSAGFYQGDIRIPIPKGPTPDRTKRNFPHDIKRWPYGIVPYSFGWMWANDTDFKAAVKLGMDYIESKTCIRFVPWTDQDHRINFVRQVGCSSYVGMVWLPAQNIDLTYGCTKIGIVMHEILHALGFHHEHERVDRDAYIRINESNIEKGEEYSFELVDLHLMEDYDVDSVMHYGRLSFAKDWHYDVITQLKDFDKGTIGQRTHLSKTDIKEINDLYGCGNVIDRPFSMPTTTTTTSTTSTTTTEQRGIVTFACNFESGDWCGMYGQSRLWSITPSGFSGLGAQYRVGDEDSKYVLRRSRINVVYMDRGKEICVKFRYKMDRAGELAIALTGEVIKTFTEIDNQWHLAQATVKGTHLDRTNNKVRILVKMMRKEFGNIYIDDVTLSTGYC